MATKPKNPEYLSPRGIFKYPSLNTPDYGNDTVPIPNGVFKTGIIVSLEDAQDLINKLMPVYEDALNEGRQKFKDLPIPARKKLGEVTANMFYETEYDKETEEETGNVIFKAKTNYRRVNKKTKEVTFGKITLVDAKGKPFPKALVIYGGSEGRISFTTSPYFVTGTGMVGISLYLNAVQIIKHVGPGERTGASIGFDVEDGYDASDYVAPEEDGDGSPSPSSNGNPEDF